MEHDLRYYIKLVESAGLEETKKQKKHKHKHKRKHQLSWMAGVHPRSSLYICAGCGSQLHGPSCGSSCPSCGAPIAPASSGGGGASAPGGAGAAGGGGMGGGGGGAGGGGGGGGGGGP